MGGERHRETEIQREGAKRDTQERIWASPEVESRGYTFLREMQAACALHCMLGSMGTGSITLTHTLPLSELVYIHGFQTAYMWGFLPREESLLSDYFQDLWPYSLCSPVQFWLSRSYPIIYLQFPPGQELPLGPRLYFLLCPLWSTQIHDVQEAFFVSQTPHPHGCLVPGISTVS